MRLFLEGRRHDLMKSLEERMTAAAEQELFEQAAAYRDLLRTLEDIEERQRIAAAQGDDTDVLAYYAEPPLVAANFSICVVGAWWTAANFIGKSWKSSILRSSFPRC